MNEIPEYIAALQHKGWTLAAIADEVGVTRNAVEKWKAGERYPANSKATIAVLVGLGRRRKVPKKRRYNMPRSVQP